MVFLIEFSLLNIDVGKRESVSKWNNQMVDLSYALSTMLTVGRENE